MKVKCECGKTIYRRKKYTVNKYGTWPPKCNTCKKEETRTEAYILKQSTRNKELYRTDPEFREKAIERAKDRYWNKRHMVSNLTKRDKNTLNGLNSYPVMGPGCLGTSEPTTNWRIITYKGVKRVKGAVYLEKYTKKFRNLKKKC